LGLDFKLRVFSEKRKKFGAYLRLDLKFEIFYEIEKRFGVDSKPNLKFGIYFGIGPNYISRFNSCENLTGFKPKKCKNLSKARLYIC